MSDSANQRRCPKCRIVWEEWWRQTFGGWGCGRCGWRRPPRPSKRLFKPFTWVG